MAQTQLDRVYVQAIDGAGDGINSLSIGTKSLTTRVNIGGLGTDSNSIQINGAGTTITGPVVMGIVTAANTTITNASITNLGVTANASMTNVSIHTLSVVGQTTLANVGVAGQTTLQNTSVNGTLRVDGQTTLINVSATSLTASSLTILNNVSVGGNVSVGSLYVSSNLVLPSGSNTVLANASINGTLRADGVTTLKEVTLQNASINLNTRMDGSLTVKGATEFYNTVASKGASNTFTVEGQTTLSNTSIQGLTVSGNTSLSNTVITGTTDINRTGSATTTIGNSTSGTIVGGNCSMSSTLAVVGNCSFNNVSSTALTVGGPLTVTSATTNNIQFAVRNNGIHKLGLIETGSQHDLQWVLFNSYYTRTGITRPVPDYNIQENAFFINVQANSAVNVNDRFYKPFNLPVIGTKVRLTIVLASTGTNTVFQFYHPVGNLLFSTGVLLPTFKTFDYEFTVTDGPKNYDLVFTPGQAYTLKLNFFSIYDPTDQFVGVGQSYINRSLLLNETGEIVDKSNFQTVRGKIGNWYMYRPSDGNSNCLTTINENNTGKYALYQYNDGSTEGLTVLNSCGKMNFNILDQAKMTLLNNGNVGIGETAPTNLLEVKGTFKGTGAATLSSTLGVTGATTLSSTLGVTGAATLSSTLGVTGLSTFSGGINTDRITSSGNGYISCYSHTVTDKRIIINPNTANTSSSGQLELSSVYSLLNIPFNSEFTLRPCLSNGGNDSNYGFCTFRPNHSNGINLGEALYVSNKPPTDLQALLTQSYYTTWTAAGKTNFGAGKEIDSAKSYNSVSNWYEINVPANSNVVLYDRFGQPFNLPRIGSRVRFSMELASTGTNTTLSFYHHTGNKLYETPVLTSSITLYEFDFNVGYGETEYNWVLSPSVAPYTLRMRLFRMNVYSDKFVGIGTDAPSYPLQVNRNTSSGSLTTYKYFSKNDATIQSGSGIVTNLSIYSVGGILTSGSFVAESDRRIKTNIVDVDDDRALRDLRLLKPKTYTYKDVISKGTTPVYGFIAQEVKEVIDYASNPMSQTIPNIYETATFVTDTLTLTFNTADLSRDASGSLFPKIKIKTREGKDEFINILEVIDEHTLKVDKDLTEWGGQLDASGQVVPGNQIFVYGQEVNDFHNLNKDAIWTVATAALQEVDRQLQAEKQKVLDLQTTLTSVQEAFAASQATLASTQETLAALVSRVNALEQR